MGFTSEPILLSKSGLIMHLSSLLCYSSAFILHSSCPVWGKWACGHTLLSARCPTLLLLVCVWRGPCQSFPLLASVSFYVFKLRRPGGRRALRLTLLGANWCRNCGLQQREKSDILPHENQRNAAQSHCFHPHFSSLVPSPAPSTNRWQEVDITSFDFFVLLLIGPRNIFMTENPFGKSSFPPFISSRAWWTDLGMATLPAPCI